MIQLSMYPTQTSFASDMFDVFSAKLDKSTTDWIYASVYFSSVSFMLKHIKYQIKLI